MILSQKTIDDILSVHHTLWDALTTGRSNPCVTYNNETYDIRIPPHGGYASAILPNKNGTPFLWITQNLNKTSYGTLQIERQAKLNNDHRISWIVDTRNGGFKYIFNISTTTNDTGHCINGTIEMYDQFGTSTVWSTNPLMISKESEF